jgi:hypothetical protein
MSSPQSQLDAAKAQLISRVCDSEREVFYELIRPYERMIHATTISISKKFCGRGRNRTGGGFESLFESR